MSNRLALTKTFRFEASHVLPKHPGKCSRLHGHSWILDVTIDGEIDPETGFVVDYGRLKKVVEEFVIEKVDHYHLGSGHITSLSMLMEKGEAIVEKSYFSALGADFYPSSENLVRAFVRLLRGPIQALRTGVDLLRLTLHETCTCECTWDRREEESNASR